MRTGGEPVPDARPSRDVRENYVAQQLILSNEPQAGPVTALPVPRVSKPLVVHSLGEGDHRVVLIGPGIAMVVEPEA